ncbi:MAG: tRNA pseudouridine(38-40) synthase TruA [Gemmatimonas sp.]|nr:tRNA pseudouridine(38-40) synthase TruA [Gemmatimonas sp.]
MSEQERRRIAFTVQYDGGPYHGWQLQREHRSVQGELEGVLTKVFAGPARVLGSGRTDRGVHATGQVAAVDAPVRWTAAELRRAMNALLPQEVWIARAEEVDAKFHPRYGAVSRSYAYRIGVLETASSPFHRRWCWPVGKEVDEEKLRGEAASVVGEHSFAAFAKAGQEKRGDRCVVTEAEWQRWGDLGIEFSITANRFLHHMVRYLVGTMVEIGLGRRPEGDTGRLLEAELGLTTSPPAPPEGLFLTGVRYPEGTYPTGDGGGGRLKAIQL